MCLSTREFSQIQDEKLNEVKIENEFKSLRDDIKILKMQVAELTKVLNQVSNKSNWKTPPCKSSSSIIMAETNNFETSSEVFILQLDGNTSTNQNQFKINSQPNSFRTM